MVCIRGLTSAVFTSPVSLLQFATDPECSRHEPNQMLLQQQQDTFSDSHWSHKGDMLQAAFTLKIFFKYRWIFKDLTTL